MASIGLRFLVKAHPAERAGTFSIGVKTGNVTLIPLLPDIQQTARSSLSVAAAPVWHLATIDRDDINPWDACHALVRAGAGFGSRAGISFAEPDIEQQWLWAPQARQVLGISGECGLPERQDADVYAVGPSDNWFGGADFSQLDNARKSVRSPAKAKRIRIAHLDTGYDRTHVSKPKNVLTRLERDFTQDPPGKSATDPGEGGILTNAGHGTATLALLAGNLKDGTPLGGAANLDVVPIRVAKRVELFWNSEIAQALNYVYKLSLNPATRIDVVTMSMGGLASSAWADAVNALYDRGIFMVTAAGNNFGGLPTRYIVYPARFHRVVAACGVMADGRPYADLPIRKMAGCYGPESKEKTAIAAYTPNVPWARMGCPDLIDWDGNGTSSATPQIAAAAALWLQRHRDALDGKYDADKGWMRVEAVRKALFESAVGGDPKHFGEGALKAADALAIPPANAAALSRTEPDDVSFPLIRVLTGLGARAELSDAQRMLELEAMQISQQSREIEEVLAGLDPGADGASALDEAEKRRLFEALADHGKASEALKQAVSRFLHGTSGRGRRPPPPAPAPVATGAHSFQAEAPSRRALRIFAFDPLLGTELETIDLNEATVSVPWEKDLKPGPVGEYFEVVDIDPASGSAYAPVDLGQPEILAQNGLTPAEGLPQFHQQMVYAVAMKTVAHFERALGRVALWAEREHVEDGDFRFRFVRRLRVYPHALREANAYYDPDKWALLFGYFNAVGADVGDNMPGGLVFTCLSHDVVAHETCHALLDGIHPHYKEPTNRDMWAFHEAFADIVALFQHFTMPEALRHQIAKSRGDLGMADLLGSLAGQFGQALGERGALRNFISVLDEETGKWKRVVPTPDDYEKHTEPHDRGAVLVGAVFDAFIRIYEHRTRDLVRLATGGTGILPDGAIPHDLVERLAREAAKTADHVLTICIRALDYCPPVDLTFGEYLRALVTADRDLMPEDDRAYRVAFVSAFRARGIFPPGVSNLSVDALAWQRPDIMMGEEIARKFKGLNIEWRADSDRYKAYIAANEAAEKLYDELAEAAKDHEQLSLNLLGVILTAKKKTVVIDGVKGEVSKSRVLSVRPVRRVGANGKILNDVVIEITQRWTPNDSEAGFFRGGCTIIYDSDAGSVKYVIRKRLGNKVRVEKQREFFARLAEGSPASTYSTGKQLARRPFAVLHRDM